MTAQVAQTYLIPGELTDQLLSLATNESARKFIDTLEKAVPNHLWEPIGGNPYNDGPIELGKDAPTQLVERVVNAIEACFELQAKRDPTTQPQSPDAAAHAWFAVPSRGVGAMTDEKAVRSLALRTVRVHLMDSGNSERPTVRIEDQGIGQHPAAFSTSLLSLHRSEKRESAYLIGKYGHGGATTLMYSEFTIVASRRAPDLLNGRADLIGFTIVRYRPGRVKGGTYEYLCGPEGAILSAQPQSVRGRFAVGHGTTFVHVGYDLHRYSAAYRQQRTGMWALLNSSLYDPHLPIHITGERKRDLHGDPNAASTGRIIKGNAAVLDGLPTTLKAKPASSTTDVDDSDTRPFLRFSDDISLEVAQGITPLGRIRVRIWVIGGAPTVESYVRAEQTITLTISGQRHGQRGRDFLKACKLGFLAKRTVIQVAADGLNSDARRHLFPSGREQQRDNEIGHAVFSALEEYLANDALHALEEEAKNAELAKASAKVKESVRRKVAKLIQRHMAGAGARKVGSALTGTEPRPTAGPATNRPHAHRKPPQMDDSLFPSVPTVIEIVNSRRQIEAGRSGHLILSIDAKNGYLDDHREDLVVEIGGPDPGGLRHKGTGSVRGGHARLVFGTSPQTAPGTYVVRVKLIRPEAGELVATATIDVVPQPELSQPEQPSDSGMPDITWIKHQRDAVDEKERAQLGETWPPEWTGEEAGDVTTSGGSLVFRLNESFPELRKAILRRADGPAGSRDAVESLKDRYAGAVSFGMFLLNDARDKAPQNERPNETWMRSAYIALGRVQLATILEANLESDEADEANA